MPRQLPHPNLQQCACLWEARGLSRLSPLGTDSLSCKEYQCWAVGGEFLKFAHSLLGRQGVTREFQSCMDVGGGMGREEEVKTAHE